MYCFVVLGIRSPNQGAGSTGSSGGSEEESVPCSCLSSASSPCLVVLSRFYSHMTFICLHKCPCLSGFSLPGIHSSDDCPFQIDSLCLVLSWVSPHTQSCLNSCRQLRKHSQVYPSRTTTPSLCEHWEGILWHSYHQEIHELNPSHGA